MTSDRIVLHPDPRLRTTSTPCGAICSDVVHLAERMIAAMQEAGGIGLAAIQIGVARRLVVCAVPDEDDPERPRAPLVLVDPRILVQSTKTATRIEGCLSLPGVRLEIERPAFVAVRYRGLDGEEALVEAEGLLAACLQHEIDHCEGRLVIDHVSRLKRERLLARLRKERREGARRSGETRS